MAKGLPEKIIDTAHGGVDDHDVPWKVQGHDDMTFVNAVMEKDKSLNDTGYKTIALASWAATLDKREMLENGNSSAY